MGSLEGRFADYTRSPYAAMALQALEIDAQAAGRHLESMRCFGLIGLLNNHDRLAGELDQLSVGCASGLQGDELATWLRDRGVDLEDLLSRAQRWESASVSRLYIHSPTDRSHPLSDPIPRIAR